MMVINFSQPTLIERLCRLYIRWLKRYHTPYKM